MDENKTYYRLSNITLAWVVGMMALVYLMCIPIDGLRQLMFMCMFFVAGIIGWGASYMMKKIFWEETGFDPQGNKLYQSKTYPLPRWLNIFNAIVLFWSIGMTVWLTVDMRHREFKYVDYTGQYTVSQTPSYYIFEFPKGDFQNQYIEKEKIDSSCLTKLYKGFRIDIFGDTINNDVFIKNKDKKMLYLQDIKQNQNR